jgi:hypothetical protein
MAAVESSVEKGEWFAAGDFSSSTTVFFSILIPCLKWPISHKFVLEHDNFRQHTVGIFLGIAGINLTKNG